MSGDLIRSWSPSVPDKFQFHRLNALALDSELQWKFCHKPWIPFFFFCTIHNWTKESIRMYKYCSKESLRSICHCISIKSQSSEVGSEPYLPRSSTLISKAILGTPPYSQNFTYEVTAMVKQLGIPTWFMTLSCAHLLTLLETRTQH